MSKSILIFSYSFFLATVLLFTYLFVDRNILFLRGVYTGFYWDHRGATALIYTLIILVFFIFIFIFLKNLNKLSLKILIALTSVFLFFSYPTIASYDIFNYVETSRILFKYHENPYIITPAEFVGDEYLPFTRATNKTALYGPSWTIASGVPYFLGFGNFIFTLFSFKLVSLLSYLGLSFLIFKISKNRLSTALFALNPLVIIESMVSSHNDAFMMFFTLLSFYFLSKRKMFASLSSLTISMLVKFSTIFLLPVYMFAVWKIRKGKQIKWGNIYLYASLSMIFIFLISFFREEIYPWYAIWFLTFSSLIPKVRWLLYLSYGLSLGLLLTYIPYMYLGTYYGLTLILKYILLFSPVMFIALFYSTKDKWRKKLHLR